MENKNNQNQKVVRSDKDHRFPTIHLQFELKLHDIFQIIVGAYILAVPVAFTEEVWVLSAELAMRNIYWIAGMSVFFITCFVYTNIYHNNFKENWVHFVKRVLATYIVTLVAVGWFLTLIDKCPWATDHILAIKRIILVGFPASMAATISDSMK